MGEMVDVATVPGDAETVWALGVLPPVLHRSRDGGFTFEAAFSFPGGFRPQRVYVAPADPLIVVVAGYEAAFPLVLARSQDAGRTFEILRFEEAVFGRPGTATELLGLDPSRPTGDRLLLAAGSPSGSDEIFLSEDGGRSWSKVLTLSGMEVKSGFAMADDGQSVYLAGRAVFDRPGEAAAHLYRSNDGGRSFPDILASGEQGPHFNCLALAGARLFACGDEDKDGFLFAASTDQGRTWSDRVRLADIVGPPGCVGDTCLATALWLCEAYGVCSPGLSRDGGAFPGATDGPGDGTFEGDGSCSDGAPCPASTGDCGCRIPGAPGGRPAGPALLFGFGAAALWGSRRRRRRFGPVPRARKEKAR